MSPAVVKLLAMMAAMVLAAGGGWTVRGWREDSVRLEAVNEARDQMIETVQYLAGKIQEMSLASEADRQQAVEDRINFQRRLRDARRAQKPIADCTPADQPDGPAVPGLVPRFTDDFVGLWNDALRIGLPASLRASVAESADPGADLPTVEDILQNLGQNAEACNQLRTRAIECKAYVEALEAAP